MSHAHSGGKIRPAGHHRGTNYDHDHRLAEEDGSVLRRTQDKQVVGEALGEREVPEPTGLRGELAPERVRRSCAIPSTMGAATTTCHSVAAAVPDVFAARAWASLDAHLSEFLGSPHDFPLPGEPDRLAPHVIALTRIASQLLGDPSWRPALDAAVPWARWSDIARDHEERAVLLAPLGIAHAALPAQIAIELVRFAGRRLADGLLGVNVYFGDVSATGPVGVDEAIATVTPAIESYLRAGRLTKDGIRGRRPSWQGTRECLDESGRDEIKASLERSLRRALRPLWMLLAGNRPRPRLCFADLGVYGRFIPQPSGAGSIVIDTASFCRKALVDLHDRFTADPPCRCYDPTDRNALSAGEVLLHELVHAASSTVGELTGDEAGETDFPGRARVTPDDLLVGVARVGISRFAITRLRRPSRVERYGTEFESPHLVSLNEGLTEAVTQFLLADAKAVTGDASIWARSPLTGNLIYAEEVRAIATLVPDVMTLWRTDDAHKAFRDIVERRIGSARAAFLFGEASTVPEDEAIEYELSPARMLAAWVAEESESLPV